MTINQPKTMMAITITKPGGPDVLALTELACPLPRQGEVLIKIEAAGINRPDILQRKGHYPPPAGVSLVPGLEVAGTVVALGENVTNVKLNDRVCALVAGGGYAEYCVAPQQTCLPIPRNLSAIEAASLPEVFFTVWNNLFDRAELKAGETVLVHGGASGIGVCAITLCHALGIKVYVTAGTDEKCRICEQLGAAKAINYKTHDFSEEIMKLTDNHGVNVILDMVGGAYVAKEVAIMAPDGRLVFIAAMGGMKTELDLRYVIAKRLKIMGSTLRTQPNDFKQAIAKALLNTVWPLLESGKIKPVIHQVFPLKEVSAAHELMESNQHIGKIVLNVF